ncbi:MAG TPA: formate dehydrogenase accessory protein FdhE [Ottowia sp.]|uniref:formate dehydrogenase accessory protein FdhE n=1 Tax=Ottowia sp. TaxID=1898956 RepID=UPI002C7699EB|nr:formate dehydrogenase accessory protein FdhE [Ottowia sp.]HMN21521.1 formate dehydrogenase accessory protein FdhE [Ottowia sp.]
MTSRPDPSSLPSPEEILLRSGTDIPSFLPPRPASLFAERALRLRERSASHAMRDYLLLMAVVCEAQHARAQRLPAIALPNAAQVAAARASGQPLLSAVDWPRDPLWRAELHALLRQVLDKLPADSPARDGVQAVLDMPDTTLEHQAERLLAGITLGLDMAAAPLIAAGLQLYWTQLVAATALGQPDAFDASGERTHCPCCGSLPTASITRVGKGLHGQRYLHCALCNAEWRLKQVTCTHCLATEGIEYQALQALAASAPATERAAIEAETCSHCHHYLKIMHMEGDGHVEPVADDLASVTLDLLVSDAGYTRHGTNLMLLFGEGDASPEAG